MYVKILAWTKEWKDIIRRAAEISSENLRYESDEEIIDMIINNDYSSILEHITFTFEVGGISIALSREFLEHRIGVSHTGRSTRYNKEEDMKYYTPDMPASAYITYNKMIQRLSKMYLKMTENTSLESARYSLPLALHTQYLVTMNLRSLMHFLSLRLCVRAAPEMRKFAELLKKEVSDKIPIVKRFGCRGEMMGLCPENKARPKNCPFKDKIPTREEFQMKRQIGSWR
ncbi:MAG: flavin-dependent thymidylate synthase [Methanophagales virus PBV299]|uniref:Flavin-dependent thymidylate synthase n=1 Tax=Methanophagales virus PBV299 TaxID=2987730 RepID=A0ABY6GLA6_9CAUD|nr:MAG: flavin-dependent thymidylate synthase [Methanophagales virus PBV299]UYL64798.1 MAG: flavin-dependent thymidylate synthase [Methanophagales virus PBV299]